jgi:hypothetical protein
VQLANTLYEPRALWSVQQLRNTLAAPSLRVEFPRVDFLNGEKYNVTLTHLLLSPIGYPFEILDPTSQDANTFRNGRGPIFERARLSIAASGRYYLNRGYHALHVYGEEQPTGEPERLNASSPRSTRLFNTFRWEFDQTLMLPRAGTVEMRLGTFGMPDDIVFTSGINPEVRATLGFHESRAGFWPSASRIRDRQPVLTAEAAPYVVPGFGNVNNGVYLWPGNNNAILSPEAQLSPRGFLRQEIGGQGAPSSLRGFSVALDQITHDDASFVGTLPSSRIASVGERLNVRARSVQGGTQASWWRPDAPLSLVCPTMTTALVYRLFEPIMLAPGDSLDVGLEVPSPTPTSEEILTTDYQVGVSFCGSAAIQG